jgi:rhodanese-related sulfurtransferase
MKNFLIAVAVLATVGLAADLALVQPNELAAKLAAKGSQPAIFQVGPSYLYRAKHVPGAVYAGPGSKQEGLDLLKQAVEKLPHDREIVLYCGCCPWEKCPNVQPALALLKQMGFTHVKAMYVESSFAKDWTERGYPVQSSLTKE